MPPRARRPSDQSVAPSSRTHDAETLFNFDVQTRSSRRYEVEECDIALEHM